MAKIVQYGTIPILGHIDKNRKNMKNKNFSISESSNLSCNRPVQPKGNSRARLLFPPKTGHQQESSGGKLLAT
jgi:hypothetical protein